MSVKGLIDLHLSGKAARHVINDLLEELPPMPAIRQSLMRELPRGAKVKIDETNQVVYISNVDRYVLTEKLSLYERIYPEIDFVSSED